MNPGRHEHAAEQLRLAEVAIDGHRLDAALYHADEARRLDPDNPAARVLAARIQLAQQRITQAEPTRHATGAAEPPRPAPPPAADPGIEHLAQRARRHPDDAALQRAYGEACLRCGRRAEAILALQRAAALSPQDAKTRALLSQLLTGTPAASSDGPAGEAPTQRTTLPGPDSLHRVAGQLHDAARAFDQRFDEVLQDPELALEAGLLADASGRGEDAVRCLTRAAAGDDPRLRPEALGGLALALMHLGRFGQAGWVWWKLTRAQPGDARAWAGLVCVALMEDRPDIAQYADQELLARFTPRQRRTELAEMWLHAAGPLAAGVAEENRLAAGPLDGGLARAILRDTARQLRHHAEAHPDHADAHYHRAVVAETLGDLTTAQSAARRALSLNPNYAAALAMTRRLEARTPPHRRPRAA